MCVIPMKSIIDTNGEFMGSQVSSFVENVKYSPVTKANALVNRVLFCTEEVIHGQRMRLTFLHKSLRRKTYRKTDALKNRLDIQPPFP